MNLSERFIVTLLTAIDRLMDFITFGLWTKVRGDVTWMDMKVSGESSTATVNGDGSTRESTATVAMD
jgi:hypothetical protein